MGKAMTVFGLWLVVCAVCMLYQQSVQELDPYASFSGYVIFSSQNLLSPYISEAGNHTLVFSNDLSGTRPTQTTTGTSASSFQYPDWVQSSFLWANVFSPIFNFIGTPYYLFIFMGAGSTGAIMGALLSIVNLTYIILMLMGRMD